MIQITCSAMILAFVKARMTLEIDTLAQASMIHWQIVAELTRRCLPVLVNVCSPSGIQFSQTACNLTLKDLLTPISSGWSSLINPPGRMANSEIVYFTWL